MRVLSTWYVARTRSVTSRPVVRLHNLHQTEVEMAKARQRRCAQIAEAGVNHLLQAAEVHTVAEVPLLRVSTTVRAVQAFRVSATLHRVASEAAAHIPVTEAVPVQEAVPAVPLPAQEAVLQNADNNV